MDFDDIGYYEPDQAEIILDEFAEKMRGVLAGKVRDEIELLRRQNDDMKGKNEKLREQQKAVERKAKELEEEKKDLERNFYRAKFSDVLKPYLDNDEYFIVSYVSHVGPKCAYCNDERKLLFTAVNGKTILQNCDCNTHEYWYEPVKAILGIITLYKSNRDGREFGVSADFEKDVDYSTNRMRAEPRMIVKNYTDDVPEIAKTLKYEQSIVFTSAEECQKYCDYLNQQKKEHENGS
jgi:FtsZ-binding cell division protein ZapB